jgi:hypothetical protein
LMPRSSATWVVSVLGGKLESPIYNRLVRARVGAEGAAAKPSHVG